MTTIETLVQPQHKASRANGGNQDTDSGKRKYGVSVVIAGLVVIFSAFAFALAEYSQAADVSTAMAPITGVVGTIVGAYFGVQVGAAGKDKADRHRKEADDDVKKLCLRTPPDQCEGMDLHFNR
jgi:hypothetical protein